MSPPRERRELPRATLDVAATEELFAGIQDVVTVDVSELGMCYRKPADAARRESDEVFLRLRLPGSERQISVLGCVAGERVVAGQRQTSVTFAFLQDEDATALRDYVQNNASIPTNQPSLEAA